VRKLAAIGSVSKGLKASVAFYRLLGVAFPDPDGDHLEAITAAGLRVMLDSLALMKKLDPEWTEPKGRRMNLAFLCSSPAEVDAVYAKVTAAGHPSKTAPWDAFWNQRYAQVVDPDGNVVDLFAPL